uniref:Uncharacterized protein n=1 Tax=Schistocephalus solidus TaxID=70667 RepID=A0A0X3NNV4_SCHSO
MYTLCCANELGRLYPQTSTTNSGFTKENPANSVCVRFMMKSLSVGVNSVDISVKAGSKLLISRFSTTGGRNGGCTAFDSISSQFILRKKTWSRISRLPAGLQPSREVGSLLSNPLQMLKASFDRFRGYVGVISRIDWKSSSSSSPLNGG